MPHAGQASDNSYFMNRAAAEGMAFLDRMKEQGGDGVPWQVRQSI